jgi:TM2 domain-containing membrane protein YozV
MYKVIGVDGHAYGPVSDEQIRRWIIEKRLNGQTPVQPEGSPEWKPLNSYPDFAADLQAATAPVAPTVAQPAPASPVASIGSEQHPGALATASLSPPSGPSVPPAGVAPIARDARASNKVAAGVCGILLGSLGVHKFILGYTGAGVTMLLVTLLSCFVLSPITHLIGLIEGIVYLTKTDDEFVRQYVKVVGPGFSGTGLNRSWLRSRRFLQRRAGALRCYILLNGWVHKTGAT